VGELIGETFTRGHHWSFICLPGSYSWLCALNDWTILDTLP